MVNWLLATVFLIKLVDTLRPVPDEHVYSQLSQPFIRRSLQIRRLLDALSVARPSNGRRSNKGNAKSKDIYKRLAKRLPKDMLKALRQNIVEEGDPINKEAAKESVRDEQAVVVENELINALSKKSSALLENPYVEQKGQNDFLVMKPDVKDPFVTVIPNSIYYNIEKKCVNWLDECSLQGIRTRLLNKVYYPYR